MKKNIALFTVVILIFTLAGCGNAAYKKGIKYRDFPLDDDLIYEDSIVFNFEEKRGKFVLEYGCEDDVDDVSEFLQEEFESSKYSIYEEELEKDEYYASGFVDEWEFEIEAKEASGKLEDFFDTVVTIEAKEIEKKKDKTNSDDSENVNSENDSQNETLTEIAKSEEDIFFGGIKELTLGQLESINGNIFEGLFLSSIYDEINSRSYNLDFTVSTSGIDIDNEDFSLYVETEAAQNYASGDSSVAFSLGETDDNTFTNSMYFSGADTFIKKSDSEEPVYRYTPARDGSYYENSTIQQRIYAAFVSNTGSKSSSQEYAPLVERYIDLLKKHIDASILVTSQTGITLLENEEQCNLVSASLSGAAGYNAVYDLFNTINYDEDAQHLFGYIIFEKDDVLYEENEITSALNVISNLTESEKEALIFSINVYEQKGVPIGMDLSITINEKIFALEILEYNNGDENQRRLNYQAFDGSYEKLDESMIDIGQNQFHNTVVISSSNLKNNEESDIEIETFSEDGDDMVSSNTSVKVYQYEPEEGARNINIDSTWLIKKSDSENYTGNGTMSMQSSSSEGTSTLEGILLMNLSLTENPNVIPISYIEELGVSMSNYKDLYNELLSEEDGLQNDLASRCLSMLGTVIIGY